MRSPGDNWQYEERYPEAMARHGELLAWQRARTFCVQVYRVSAEWPAAERFGLVSQVRRAAVSAMANVAEGAARRNPREFAWFIRVALGSHAEVDSHLRLACDLGFLTEEQLAALRSEHAHVGRLLTGLYRAVGRR